LKRIYAFKCTSSSNPTSTADIALKLFREISERERSSRNVIINGIPESSCAILADRIFSDTSKISEAIQPYFPDLPSSLK